MPTPKSTSVARPFTPSVSRCWKTLPENWPGCFSDLFRRSFSLAQQLHPDLPIPRHCDDCPFGAGSRLRHAWIQLLAGSALYSPDGSAPRDLQTAIKRLGVEVVRTTALAIAMNQLMRSKETAVFSEFTKSLWDHSLRAAAASRLLARKFTRLSADEAMLAGLVHDLGAFYMIYRAAQYPELRIRPTASSI